MRLGTMMMLALLGIMPMFAQFTTKKAMTLAAAKEIASAAEAEARKNNWTMVIVVVDDGGNLVYLEKMDGTQIGSIEVAQAKAKSAINFKRPTKAFEDGLVGGRQALLKLPGAMPIEGGVLIMAGDQIVGAIGVSGAQSKEDGAVAAAGVAAAAKIK